jgi:hypothetical protein
VSLALRGWQCIERLVARSRQAENGGQDWSATTD